MNNVALITGAAGGLGFEFAKTFARNKHDLVIVDINGNKLEEVKSELEKTYGIIVETIIKDLSIDGAASEVFEEVKSKNIDVEILINNAGFGDFGRLIDIDYNKERAMIGVNVITVLHMTWLFANEMAKKGHGKIMNIASIASYEPGPYMPMYYATKGFIYQLTEAVAYELRDTGVTVTCLCPGPIITNFEKAADMKGSVMFKFPLLKASTPDKVAEEGYYAVMNGKLLHHPFYRFDVFKFLTRFGSEKVKLILTTYINTGKFNP